MNDPSYTQYQRFLPDGSPASKSKPLPRRKPGKIATKSCTINGVEYESQKEAAEILGIGIGTLRYRPLSSNFPKYVSKLHPKRKVIKSYARIECSIAGIKYKSANSASIALGISHHEMKCRLAPPDYPNYISPRVPKQDGIRKNRRK